MSAPVVGLDGGGTGCRARVFGPDGQTLGRAEGGPANALIGDGEPAHVAIIDTVRAALRDAAIPPETARVGLGLAGLSPEGRRRLSARPFPFAEVRVVTDAHAAALGAHRGGDGAAVILGTGAAVCVVTGGAPRTLGGWGFWADDAGSGAWIGRRLLRIALRHHDGDAAPAVADATLARWDGDPWAAADWAATASPRDFATLAPIAAQLAEAGDPLALSVIDEALREFARLVRLARDAGAPRVAALGSVARRLTPFLPEPERALVVEPLGDAMEGAALALRHGLGFAAPAGA